jgi:hypothetical protein
MERRGLANGGTLVDLAIRFGAILLAAIASVGFVAFVGAIILWSRFEAAQLPADQAVAVQPRADLVTVGAIALTIFVLGGLAAVLLLKLLDRRGEASLPTRTGLLVVMGLEIAAAFVLERWDGPEWLGPALAVLAGLAALTVLLELAAQWHRQHQESFDSLPPRMLQVFVEGDDDVSRTRLWGGVAILAAAVYVILRTHAWWSDPWWKRYVVAALVAAVAVAVLKVRARSSPERRWGTVVLALGVVVGMGAALSRQNDWVAVIAATALVLGAVNLAVAHVSGDRFLWYGLTVFASVMVFGAAFYFLRNLEDPQAQGVALLRANDAQPVCGIFVAETKDRLWYGRLDLKGTSDIRRLRNESGRLLWAPRERLVAAEIGPLESVDAAQSTALDLRQELALNREPARRGDTTPPAVPARPPRSAGGQDPCGPAPARVQHPPSPTRALAERFQPRLLLSEDDGFWPVSLLTIFDLERRGRVLCREPACVPVRSAADLPYAGGETEWLEYPGDFDDRDQQRREVVRALGSDDPFRTAREYYLAAAGGGRRTTSLQYWFFYPFNYQPLKVGRAGYHEGDFEHVGVLLSRAGAPRAVWMARHDDEGRVFLWDEPSIARRGEHVDVYVARGSHASYESCFEQERRRAPLGFINDRPECRAAKQFVLEPGQVPLWNLARARWSCWAGRFGHSRSGISKLEWQLYEGNGPRSPLWQQTYGGVRRTPCAGVTIPPDLVAEGEEPVGDDVAARITSGAGRLDPLVDECSDWRRAQPQGAYVVACHSPGLRSWLRDGLERFDGPALNVLKAKEGVRAGAAAWPVAARRDAEAASFRDWRVRTRRDARVEVYASCLVDDRPIEATFTNVPVRAAGELRLDDSLRGRWRLLDGGREVASARPGLAAAADGPDAPRKPARSTVCE